jgi:hypothetical protein
MGRIAAEAPTRLPLPARNVEVDQDRASDVSFVSLNWRGKPLESLEIAVNLIASTKTNTGRKIYARLDEGSYERDIEVIDDQLTRHTFHGDWNNTLAASHALSIANPATPPISRR